MQPSSDASQQGQKSKNSASISGARQLDEYGFQSDSSHSSAVVREAPAELKRINARFEKWRVMLKDMPERVRNKDAKLKERVRKGIPNGIRFKAWPLLAQVEELKSQNKHIVYADLVAAKEFPYAPDIEVDLPRTFPNHIMFERKENEETSIGIQSLNNVLKALSLSFKEMGYCQGINFLGAALLMYLNDEQAFWMLYSLMTKYDCLRMYQNVATINRNLYVHNQLLKRFMPAVHKLFEDISLDPLFYATSWYMTLFCAVLPFHLFLRTMDVFLNEGWKILYRIGLAVIKYKEKEILEAKNFDKVMATLRQLDCLSDFSEDQFLTIAIKDFVFPGAEIKRLEAEYDRTHGTPIQAITPTNHVQKAPTSASPSKLAPKNGGDSNSGNANANPNAENAANNNNNNNADSPKTASKNQPLTANNNDNQGVSANADKQSPANTGGVKE